MRCRITTFVLVFASSAIFALPVGATASEPPIKETLTSHIGWEVDQSTGGNICTVESKNVCQRGRESGEPGGFAYPGAVAVDNDPLDVAHFGHVYVADRVNNRVQELTATGVFVSMFGWDVNRTKTGKGAPQAERNICTAVEVKSVSVKCQAGMEGPETEKLDGPGSIAVDPASGTVYVDESVYPNQRLAAYTSSGVFLWTVGPFTSKESLIAGGPEHLLYAGGEKQVLEYEANGKPKREVTVAGAVSAIAVDATTGDMYVIYNRGVSVHQLEPGGKQVAEFQVNPGQEGAPMDETRALALDSSGHLVVSAEEGGTVVSGEHEIEFPLRWFGSLYDAATGHRITELTGWGVGDIAFSANGELYAAAPNSAETGHEVFAFRPVPVGELLAKPTTCKAGAETETDATFDCTLEGSVDAWGVKETQVWFNWGVTPALGSETPKQPVTNLKSEGEEELLVQVQAILAGLRPNEAFYYQLAGEDHNVKVPELLRSETGSFETQFVAARIVGAPVVSFASSSSVVMFGELNPENAQTEYFFEYAPELKPGETLAERCPNGMRSEACAGVVSTTPAGEASCSVIEGASRCVYGKIATTTEVSGLQPGTPYRYRLSAESINSLKTKTLTSTPGPEGSFTTASQPIPLANTGEASMIAATSAIVSGTANPDGLPATYAFELGIYNGEATQYEVVFSGPAGSSSIPVEETLALTGLQPGTTYAYRIAISSGYIKNETHTVQGSPITFTTQGLPSVLVLPTVLTQLPVPDVAFPKEPTKITQKKLTRTQQLAQALKTCEKKPKNKRAACRRGARKKYAANRTKAKIVNTNAKGRKKHG